jgi:alpha-ketoglutarate-dependent taurine dioxygenase
MTATIELTSAVGARVEGVDLTTLDAAGAAAIRAALDEHGVLVVPGQHMTRDEHVAFARMLGEPHGHPVQEFLTGGPADPVSVVENDETKAPQGDQHFHVDYSFAARIPDLAILRAEVVPPRGGDTIWSSLAAAHDALSEPMKAFLAQLTARHDAGERFWFEMRRTIGEDAAQRARDHFDGNSHPVICAHPRTGRPLLFVNPGYTTKINELSDAESAGVLRMLFDHVNNPAFHVRHKWTAGDVVLWDEHQTAHMGPSDFFPHHRRLVRVTAGSAQPSGIAVGVDRDRD